MSYRAYACTKCFEKHAKPTGKKYRGQPRTEKDNSNDGLPKDPPATTNDVLLSKLVSSMDSLNLRMAMLEQGAGGSNP